MFGVREMRNPASHESDNWSVTGPTLGMVAHSLLGGDWGGAVVQRQMGFKDLPVWLCLGLAALQEQADGKHRVRDTNTGFAIQTGSTSGSYTFLA